MKIEIECNNVYELENNKVFSYKVLCNELKKNNNIYVVFVGNYASYIRFDEDNMLYLVYYDDFSNIHKYPVKRSVNKIELYSEYAFLIMYKNDIVVDIFYISDDENILENENWNDKNIIPLYSDVETVNKKYSLMKFLESQSIDLTINKSQIFMYEQDLSRVLLIKQDHDDFKFSITNDGLNGFEFFNE